MKLRILSIGLRLDNDQITNADLLEARSFHDFDVVLIDPTRVIELFSVRQAIVEIMDGYRVIKWDNIGTGQRIAATIKRRKLEARQFLECGRLMICTLRALDTAYLCSHVGDAPNPNQEDKWVNNYGWFPLHYSDFVDFLLPASGDKISLSDSTSPFASYFNDFDNQLYYKAYLDEARTPYYFEDFRALAKTYGGFPVAFTFELDGGQVVFLPPIENPDPKKLADVLLGCILTNRGTIEQTEPPPWLSNYKASVPGLLQLEQKIETHTVELQKLTAQLDDLGEQKAEKEKYLKLLYEQGKFQLEPVVRDAFSLLGFTVTDVEPSDGLLQSTEGTALLEVEGKDDSAIKIDKYRQLLDYVVDDERETQEAKKGILVGNGFRLKDPKERGEQFTQRAADGGAGSHFCLISTDTLFHLACQVLEKPDNGQLKSQIRTRLLTTDGVFHLQGESNGGEERHKA